MTIEIIVPARDYSVTVPARVTTQGVYVVIVPVRDYSVIVPEES